MNNQRKNKRGELLVWPGAGPIGDSEASIKSFEAFVSESFGAEIEFVEDLTRRDGKVDTVIRFNSCGRDGSEIIFRMFCVSVGIYPISIISKRDYDIDSFRKILK